jgi:hypothetical protein
LIGPVGLLGQYTLGAEPASVREDRRAVHDEVIIALRFNCRISALRRSILPLIVLE